MVQELYMLATKYLLIGNSAGGIGAAEAIREVDREGSITIVSDEPYPCYSRPLISRFLTAERDLDGILFRSTGFYEENSVNARLGRQVKHLDLAGKTAELDDGKTAAWEKLLLAPGGKPVELDIGGAGTRGVFTFTKLDDAKAIMDYLEGGSREAAVVGAGLIAISVTEALIKMGVKVHLIVRSRIMKSILDEQASAIAEESLKTSGVDVIKGTTVSEIRGQETVTGVMLEDGQVVPCGMVIMAVGVETRVALLEGTDIEINSGILVDKAMMTSHPDVYACGDAAEAYDFIRGDSRINPLWPNAYIGGRVAGHNMAGKKDECKGLTSMNSISCSGLDIVSAGLVDPPSEDEYEVMSCWQEGKYRRLNLKGNVIVGMVCIGDIDRSGILLGLMRDRVEVNSFKEKRILTLIE